MKPPPTTEESLMAAYASGDDRAFAALFAALSPRILHFFRRCFPDAAIADDLMQATFVRMHLGRHTYRTGAPVRPWVFTIAARVRIDELRRRYRLPPSTGEDALENLEVPVDPHERSRLDEDSRAARVRDAIDALPAGQRVVIQLHRFENMTFGEIAGVLGLNEGAVRVRAFRGYAVLREALAPMMREEEP